MIGEVLFTKKMSDTHDVEFTDRHSHFVSYVSLSKCDVCIFLYFVFNDTYNL